MRDTRCRLERIDVWADRTHGSDPRTHFWFQASDGVVRKVCDGSIWTDQVFKDNGLGFVLPCFACRELYIEDAVHGRHVLALGRGPAEQNRNREPVPVSGGSIRSLHGEYTEYNGCTSIGGNSMPIISMTSFAEFCEARASRRQSIIREARLLTVDHATGAGRNYYGPLIALIRRTHWHTGDISVFKDAFPLFLTRKWRKGQAERFQKLAEAYISYCEPKNLTYASLPSTRIVLAGLTITVHPELLMHTEGGDQQVMRLWLKGQPPSRPVRRTVCHLIERAARSAAWSEVWPLESLVSLWDIERGEMLPAIPTDNNFNELLDANAAAFLAMWEQLERTAQDAEE